MPNWCANTVSVTADSTRVPAEARGARLREFHRFARTRPDADERKDRDVFDFNSFVPYPEQFRELDRIAQQKAKEFDRKMDALNAADQQAYRAAHWHELPKDGFNQGGYEWCVIYWGTKWGACEPTCDDSTLDGPTPRLIYKFSTAWSPPEPVLQKASELFPDLIFRVRWHEEGGSKGGGVWRAGVPG